MGPTVAVVEGLFRECSQKSWLRSLVLILTVFVVLSNQEVNMARYARDIVDLAIMEDLGEVVAEARYDQDLTQTEVAEAIGLSRGSVANIERGAQMPTIRTLMDICAVLGIDPNTILNWR